jgi:hypothetical protein
MSNINFSGGRGCRNKIIITQIKAPRAGHQLPIIPAECGFMGTFTKINAEPRQISRG